MSNSPLVTYTLISPNKSSRNGHAIDTITIHCFVGQVTAKRGCEVFQKSNSCNYVVGYDGSIGLVVEEKDRSWCTSSRVNDERAVTIEVASETKHPYKVTNKAYAALIALVTDICKRNGIDRLVWSTSKSDRVNHRNGCNMTVHRDYENKACPGKYLYDRHGQIAEAVNKILVNETPVKEETKTVDISMPILRKGSSGNAVKTLQRLLRQLEYVNSDGKTYITVDGSFGSNTEAAVKRYQKNCGAKNPDGIVGKWTWNKLLKGR